MRVLWGADADVMSFVARRMPPMFGDSIRYAGEYRAAAVIDGEGVMQAGVVFNDYQPNFGTVMVHLAADTPRWATHNIVKEILGWAFITAKCNKVWGHTPSHLTRVLRFNHGIGFVREAVLRDQYGTGRHAVVTGMLAKEYRKFYIYTGGIQALLRHRAKMRFQPNVKEAA